MNKFKNVFTAVLFGTIIFTCFLICILKPTEAFSESERRPLAQFPEISLKSILSGEFSEGFEKYSTDNFILRDDLRTVKAIFSTKFLGKKDNNGLFSIGGHISKLDSAENEQMMEYATDKFDFIKKTFLNDTNKIYLSVVPDKNFVLAEKNGYPSLDYKGFTEKVRANMPYAEYIDITGFLSEDDYYTTDSHWRQEKIVDIAEYLGAKMGTDTKDEYEKHLLDNPFYGVYAGQSALPVSPDTIFYLKSNAIDNAKVTYYDTGAPKEGDMYNMKKAYGKDPYEMFLSGTTPIVTIENENAKGEGELIMFRDSFASSLAPLLTSGYKKITLVDIRYVQSVFLGGYIGFENSDILFIYSTTLLNNSMAMK